MPSKFVIGIVIKVLLNDQARAEFVRDLTGQLGEGQARRVIADLQRDLDRLYPPSGSPKAA